MTGSGPSPMIQSIGEILLNPGVEHFEIDAIIGIIAQLQGFQK